MTTKELLALVGKASELPWEAYSSEVWSVGNNREVAHRPDFNTTPNGYGQWDANAALIVAAVNALPALCAEVEAWREFYFAQVERDAAATSREKDSRGLVVGYINPGYGKTVSERDAYEAENQRLKAASNDAFARENLAIYKLAIAGERCAALAAKEPK